MRFALMQQEKIAKKWDFFQISQNRNGFCGGCPSRGV
jgi:hypothetical protein